ncbi:MAG: hypothetical protein J4N78_02950 [Chloroflexi bacterium]|nr:hypothetical protein [Chloroflexota bacterium]
MSSGVAVWLALLVILVFVVLILVAIMGMNTPVLIITVVGALLLGFFGLFLLRKLFG